MSETITYRDANDALKDVSAANPLPVSIGGGTGAAPVAGTYNTTQPTLTNGQRGEIQLDSRADLLISQATKIAGEDLSNDVLKAEFQYSTTRISTATTTVIKASPGYLKSITVCATAAGAITVYNNTAASGTIVTVLKASIAEQTFTFDAVMSTGITIVTAAASDITVTYR